MSIEKDFDEILDYAHMWHWAPDWALVKEIYKEEPLSFSVLTPFAYTYLEEIIRTTTSDYGTPLHDRDENPVSVKLGKNLIDLAIKENQSNTEYILLLEQMRGYFKPMKDSPESNGRNKVMHGHWHPNLWCREQFEQLIHDIALLSKYSQF